MSSLVFYRKFILLIFLCGVLLCLFPRSAPTAENRALSFDNRTECSAVLLKNQEYFPALIKRIDEAQGEIIMSFFLFKVGVHKNSYPDRVLAHLVKSVQRGLRVMVVLEHSGGHDLKLDAENRRTRQLLAEKGIEVYFDSQRKTTHTKLVIIDRRLIVLGSHNLTQAALRHNNEMSIMMENTQLAEEARDYLFNIIKGAK